MFHIIVYKNVNNPQNHCKDKTDLAEHKHCLQNTNASNGEQPNIMKEGVLFFQNKVISNSVFESNGNFDQTLNSNSFFSDCVNKKDKKILFLFLLLFLYKNEEMKKKTEWVMI